MLLNAADFVGPYLFPNNSRRRIPGLLYLLIGSGCLALWFLRDDESTLVNGGIALGGIGLILTAVYFARLSNGLSS